MEIDRELPENGEPMPLKRSLNQPQRNSEGEREKEGEEERE